MSEQENMAAIQEIFDAYSKGDLSILDKHCAPNFVRQLVGMPPMGKDEYRQLLMGLGMDQGTAKSTVDEMIADGDRVAFRVTHVMTHSVPVMGIPPTGKEITVHEAYFSRFENGKIAEWWCLGDMLALYQGLGIQPPLPPGS